MVRIKEMGLADYKFKKGDRVVFHPSAGYREWSGIVGTVTMVLGEDYRVDLDKRPDGWGFNYMSTYEESRYWLRLLKPLSSLEQQIAAYVKSEMAQLGVS